MAILIRDMSGFLMGSLGVSYEQRSSGTYINVRRSMRLRFGYPPEITAPTMANDHISLRIENDPFRENSFCHFVFYEDLDIRWFVQNVSLFTPNILYNEDILFGVRRSAMPVLRAVRIPDAVALNMVSPDHGVVQVKQVSLRDWVSDEVVLHWKSMTDNATYEGLYDASLREFQAVLREKEKQREDNKRRLEEEKKEKVRKAKDATIVRRTVRLQ